VKLLNVQHDSASIEECVSTVVLKSREQLGSSEGFISSAKIDLTFGAFMNLSVTMTIDDSSNMSKGILADYAHGRNRSEALSKAISQLNSHLPPTAKIVTFETGTYVTPVTRRTYAVAVAVYNVPIAKKNLEDFDINDRRNLLHKVLSEFNYNPKVLNISEIARTFGVSRDSIYYDIEQILKEKKGAKRR